MPSKRRFFNKREKVALHLLADGKCEICGKRLDVGWHADHVYPYSDGGLTDIVNGQALCPDCNLMKGTNMNYPKISRWPESFALRDWQENALLEWQKDKPRNFLAVATPGAGKTRFALRLAHQLLEARIINRLFIVCPTTHLRKQWAGEANKVGIDIDPNWSNSDFFNSKDYCGAAITYHQAASGVGPDVLRGLCSRAQTLVIFDEIHHAGEDRSWGMAISHAFDEAHYRILLSGTPFRHDNQMIPYVRYDQNYSYPDFTYGYGDALRDGVCRPVFFPSYEGDMKWLSKRGKFTSASFSDKLNQEQAAERLRTALDHRGNWLKDVITEAHQRLIQIREDEHKDAGGLIIAMDQIHAENIAQLVHKITGEYPRLAISDVPDASGVISRFANERNHWIVAVRMVSEGVDIPRLRVLVYATNITSELFFRQAVGRVVRTLPNLEEQSALFYMPAEEILLQYAHAIKEDREHIISDEIDSDSGSQENKSREGSQNLDSYYAAISSEAIPDNVIVDKLAITQEELLRAREYAKDKGYLRIPPEFIAQMMRDFIGMSVQSPPQKVSKDGLQPKFERVKTLRTQVATLCNKYAMMTGTDFKDVHLQWIKQGGMSQSKATEDDLLKKRDWILRKIEEYGDGQWA